MKQTPKESIRTKLIITFPTIVLLGIYIMLEKQKTTGIAILVGGILGSFYALYKYRNMK